MNYIATCFCVTRECLLHVHISRTLIMCQIIPHFLSKNQGYGIYILNNVMSSLLLAVCKSL